MPHWPIVATEILIPLPENHGIRKQLQQRAKEIKINLENRVYNTIEEFFEDKGFISNGKINIMLYKDVIRASIIPNIILKRNIGEILTNPFNPWISSFLTNTAVPRMLWNM